MNYKSSFTSINGEHYYLYLGTPGTGSKDIVLGGSPFTTEMKTPEYIYEPLRLSGAKISVVTPDYLMDLYSASVHHTSVTLKDHKGADVWCGYLEPNLYTQGYNTYLEEIELNAVDGLSTLEYQKYEAQTRETRTLAEVIARCVKAAGCYSGFGMSIYTEVDGKDEILTQLCISEKTFFGEKKDNETDSDVAWSYKEVLSEVCRFLNVTAWASGDYVYLTDWDALKNKTNQYNMYDLSGNYKGGGASLSYGGQINHSAHSDDNATISLSEVYNKIKVTDKFDTYDNVIPGFFDNTYNITASSDPNVTAHQSTYGGGYGEILTYDLNDKFDKTNYNTEALVSTYGGESTLMFIKYLDSTTVKTYHYDKNKKLIGTQYGSLNYSDTKGITGGVLMRMDQVHTETSGFWLNVMKMVYDSKGWSLNLIDTLMQNANKGKLSFTDYVMLLNPDWNYIPNEEKLKFPFVEITSEDSLGQFGGKNAYFVINFKYIYHSFSSEVYPGASHDVGEGRYAMNNGQTWVNAKFKVGDYYWDGARWTTNESFFHIDYLPTSNMNERRADATMFHELSIVTKNDWRKGISEEGYVIPLPEYSVITGYPTLTLYAPNDPYYTSVKSDEGKGQHYKHHVAFLKDFSIKCVIGDPTYADANNTDTVYATVIDENNVKEAPEIEFKICTNDGKKPNRNSVTIDKSYTVTGDKRWLDNTVRDGVSYRQEQHMCDRMYRQYCVPNIVLDFGLRHVMGGARQDRMDALWHSENISGTFIPQSVSVDYKAGSMEVSLINKQ